MRIHARINVVLLLLPLSLPVAAQTPSIGITHVPAYGSTENLAGRVTGVTPADYHVGTFLFMEGLGWYQKPTNLAPCTSIDASGNFNVDVTTGGSDSLAHRYAVFLIPMSDPCPIVNGQEYLPSALLALPMHRVERSPFMLSFSGYNWVKRNSPYLGGPSSNCFSPERAFVDGQGHLRLTLAASGCGGEIWLARSLGYGEYRIHTVGRIDNFDPQAVFGMFTWDPEFDPGHRELDVELSRWGVAGDPLNAQFVVQPFNQPGNRERFPLVLTDAASQLTFLMQWVPGSVTFKVYHGHHLGIPPASDLIHEKLFTSGLPVPGAERFRFNLWRFCGDQCALSQDQEAVITHFGHVSTPFDFYTLAPCRMLDTRSPSGRFGGPALLPGPARLFDIKDRCGIPATARAVSFNLTVIQPSAGGYLVLYPAGTSAPLASSINYSAGQTRANNAILPLGDFQQLAVQCVQQAGSVHFILDVNGYFE